VIEVLVATRNAHKTWEIQHILGPQFNVKDLTAHPDIAQVAETGRTFEQNAKMKAVAVSKRIPGLVIADDSGHWRELMPEATRVALDSAVLSRSPAMAVSLELLTESWKEESLMNHAASADSATTRSSFPRDLNEPSVNYLPT
jgi:hypothetical protein